MADNGMPLTVAFNEDKDENVGGSCCDDDSQREPMSATDVEERASEDSDENSDDDSNEAGKNDSDNDDGSADNIKEKSSSDSGSDVDSSSDSDSGNDDDSEGAKPKDGISDYERLRLERIKRNQERLAALGLQDGTLKPKPKISHRRKSLERKVPLEPTRKQISRSSKKRIDYSEQPKLHTVAREPKSKSRESGSALPKPPPKELTPEELARREKRRKEKRENERIPRFIYDEFQRIRSKRKLGLKKAKRHVTKAEREKNHWEKTLRKLTAQEQKREAMRKKVERKKEAMREKVEQKRQKEKEARIKEQAEREELDCKGMTKKELLQEIELRKPELFGILAGHDKEKSAKLEKLQQEAKEKEEIRKRQSLDRKLAVIDALDRYPKAMNEALTKLNALLYSRAPKDSLPPRRSVRRKDGVAIGPGQTNTVANIAKSAKSNKSSTSRRKISSVTEAKVASMIPETKQHNEPLKKKRKLIGSTGASDASTAVSIGKNNISAKEMKAASRAIHGEVTSAATDLIVSTATHSNTNTIKKKRGRPSLALPIHSSTGGATNSSLSMMASLNNSGTIKNKKRGRSAMTLPIHSHNDVPTKSEPADVSNPTGFATMSTKSQENKTDTVEGATSGVAKKQRKPRDARYVGGWISPKFAKELDRTWLERTKPIDNRPVTLVPEDVAKLAGVSAKKTAVFDLGSYVPQAGDIILYYPSAHKDVLNTHPDTLGSRQRNLLRVPLWARAGRSRNRLNKEDEKGTIWWTDEWIESLMTPRIKSKKDRQTVGVESSRGDQNDDKGGSTSICNACIGDYPIICRVERTHAEFPEDPYAKEKSVKIIKKDKDQSADGNTGDTSAGNVSSTNEPKLATGNRLSLLAVAEANKKQSKITPHIRLAVMLKPLSPIIAPCEYSVLSGGRSLGLPPTFTVVTFPVAAPLEPFIVPFCWGYTSFHSLVPSETIWIQRSSSVGNDGNRSKSGIGSCGKGKIIDFLAAAKAGMRAIRAEEGDEGHAILSTPTSGYKKDSVHLLGNVEELKILLESLTEDDTIQQQAIIASLASDKEYNDAIPIREANIIVDFLRKYSEKLEGKKNETAKTPSSPPQQVSSTEVPIAISRPSLVAFILKTLPLRRGLLVAFDSNRRQLHKASPWNLATLQPTDLSRSIQDGLLGYLENSLREKAILCMKDLIENHSHAQLFVPMVTELIAPAYYSAVPVGMSLGRILARLKAYGNTGSCYYTSMESILMDINLISENCLLYNHSESDLVSYCRDIIPKCQTMIKDIIQNRNTKTNLKALETDPSGKRHTLVIPSFLNTPFKENINWEWLQQMTPLVTSTDGETVTRQATSSTWIPQCGESIFYSLFNHSKFVSDYHEFLDDLQCIVPAFRNAEFGKQKENPDEDEFFAKTSTHWLEGTVVSVRSSFPRPKRKKNEASIVGVTPILIIELRLHYTQVEGNIFVCWRPIFESIKCRGSGLAPDSFLKPTWTCNDGMQMLPSNLPSALKLLPISSDLSISITKCFDFLKQRCIDGISPEAVNPDLSLENAEHGTLSNFDSQFLPSYSEFFTPADMKHGTRGIKRIGYKLALKALSNVGYMPLWGFENQQNREERSGARHESWMPFPSLCLELIRLRISNGYYKNLNAVVNDITESYICSVLFLLSETWTRNSGRVSIRKIAKYLMSPKGNGKMSRIAIKKKSKKMKIDETQVVKNKSAIAVKKKSKILKESPFDKLSEEEEVITQQVFQIRRYHAAAIVFSLETSHVEKIFSLVSTAPSEPIQDELLDVDASMMKSYSPEQLDGVEKIRRLLRAVRRDQCRNRFKFSYRDNYKVKIRYGEHLITENGHLDTMNDGTILFQPSAMTASLPDGSQMKLKVRCENTSVFGEMKVVTDRSMIEPKLTRDDHTESSSQIVDVNQPYHSSVVGRNHFSFKSADFVNNEELVRSLFGLPGRMQPCVQCQANGGSLFSCRVLRQHSNPDYDLINTFKGTSGVEHLLNPWKESNGEDGNVMVSTESNIQNAGEVTTISQQTVTDIDLDEEDKKEAEARKEAEEKEVTAALATKVLEARDKFERADKAHKSAKYLHTQALLLSDLEVKLSEDFISTNFPFDPADNHYIFCIHCGCAGDLLICDGCPNVSHPKCAGLNTVPDGDWFCHKCTSKQNLASKPEICSGEVGEVHRIVESSNRTRKIVEGSSQADDECCRDSSFESGKPESSENANASTNQEEAKVPSSIKSENSSPQPLDIPLKQVNVLPTLNRTVSGNEMKIEESDSNNSAEIGGNPTKSSITANIDSIENRQDSNKIIGLEINDEEFDEKESELDAVLSDLINKRLPPKPKSVEQEAQPKSGEQKGEEQGRDPLDALGNNYIREFLTFIGIESAEELLSTKTGLIAHDLKFWREQEGMNPLSEKGYSSSVSTWKNMVRKASAMASHHPKENNGMGGDNEEKSNLEILPSQGRKFCSHLRITEAEVFLATRTSDLARKYASWRKKQNLSKLAGDGASAYISSWKSKVRKHIDSISTDPEDDKESRTVPIGFKVRKLFDDGNYYDGKVISGPNQAFDVDKGKNVLCWRVKYLDDDEEEFTIDELDLWGIQNDENPKVENSRNPSANTEDTSSTVKSESTPSAVNNACENPSIEIGFPQSESMVNLSSENSSPNTTSRDVASTENNSIGTKVHDLQFAPEPSTNYPEGKKSKTKRKQKEGIRWDSSPLVMRARDSLANESPQRSSPVMHHRKSRRLSVPVTVADGKPIQKTVAIADKSYSSTEEVTLETKGRGRRSTRNRPSEEAIANEGKALPARSETKSIRDNSNIPLLGTKIPHLAKGDTLADSTMASTPNKSAELTSREKRYRRSTRIQTGFVEEEGKKEILDKAKEAGPRKEGRRRSSRFSR